MQSAEYLSAWFWVYNLDVLNLAEKSSHDTRKSETTKLLAIEVPLPSLSEQQQQQQQQQQIPADLRSVDEEFHSLSEAESTVAASIKALLPAILNRDFSHVL